LLLKIFNCLKALDAFELLVRGQVVQQLLRCQFLEALLKDIAFILEEFIDGLLRMNSLEDVGS